MKEFLTFKNGKGTPYTILFESSKDSPAHFHPMPHTVLYFPQERGKRVEVSVVSKTSNKYCEHRKGALGNSLINLHIKHGCTVIILVKIYRVPTMCRHS